VKTPPDVVDDASGAAAVVAVSRTRPGPRRAWPREARVGPWWPRGIVARPSSGAPAAGGPRAARGARGARRPRRARGPSPARRRAQWPQAIWTTCCSCSVASHAPIGTPSPRIWSGVRRDGCGAPRVAPLGGARFNALDSSTEGGLWRRGSRFWGDAGRTIKRLTDPRQVDLISNLPLLFGRARLVPD